jgi:hypothetical protein
VIVLEVWASISLVGESPNTVGDKNPKNKLWFVFKLFFFFKVSLINHQRLQPFRMTSRIVLGANTNQAWFETRAKVEQT